jgi:hypothetical protein
MIGHDVTDRDNRARDAIEECLDICHDRAQRLPERFA